MGVGYPPELVIDTTCYVDDLHENALGLHSLESGNEVTVAAGQDRLSIFPDDASLDRQGRAGCHPALDSA